MKKQITILILSLLVVGCVAPQSAYLEGSSKEVAAETEKQKIMILQKDAAYEKRLQNVAYPILTKNKDLCSKNIAPKFGLSFWTKQNFPDGYKAAAQKTFGVTDQPSISFVTASSPAARAGLRPGDVVYAINGTKITTSEDSLDEISKALRQKSYKPSTLDIVRSGKRKQVSVTPVAACDYQVILQVEETDINAYADGENIFVNKPIMNLARSDNELALVVAHEFAHNAAGHIDAKMQNAVGAGIVGFLLEVGVAAAGGYTDGSITNNMMSVGAQAHSVGFEQEADYIGMYAMAKAGYSTANVANFWRAMATETNSDSVTVRTDHPTSPERFVAIEKTHKEIMQKRAAGKPLTPNMKVVEAPKDNTPTLNN